MTTALNSLPQPSDAFEWVQAPAAPALVCRELRLTAPHLFTSRGWRLGARSADEAEAWGEVSTAIGVGGERLIRARQVHGAHVLVAGRAGGPAAGPDADIVIGSDQATALAVQTADCVPILLADTRTGAVAAAHAGWRGLAARVPHVAVEALVREFGVLPATLVAAIGPSIGPCCYEVGDDVRTRFEEAGFSVAELSVGFRRSRAQLPNNPTPPTLARAASSDRWFLDLWACTRSQLVAAGVPAGRVHTAALCTASHAVFCSYRRDGAGTGRMAGVIRPGGRRR